MASVERRKEPDRAYLTAAIDSLEGICRQALQRGAREEVQALVAAIGFLTFLRGDAPPGHLNHTVRRGD